MATLQELIDANPQVLFYCEESTVAYQFNRIDKVTPTEAVLRRLSDDVFVNHSLASTGWEIHEPTPEDLEVFRYESFVELDEEAKTKRAEYLTPGLDLTYANKRLECEAFRDAGYPEGELDDAAPFIGAWPYVSSWKHAGGFPTGQAAADDVLGLTAQLAVLDSAIEDIRLGAKKQIRETNDPGAIRTIKANAKAAIKAIGS